MSSALLSRFDLVFILLDCPDEEMDCLLSEHVMSLHAGGGTRKGRGPWGVRAGGATPAAGGGVLRATARRNEEVSPALWGGVWNAGDPSVGLLQPQKFKSGDILA